MNKRGESVRYFNRKKGQVTLFIIIALLIIGGVILFFFLSPDIRTDTSVFDETNPQAFMQACLEDDLRDIVETVSLQGGSMDPERNVTYLGVDIGYVCYTDDERSSCIVQPLASPSIQNNTEMEIETELIKRDYVKNCFDSLIDNYRERGYEVQPETGKTEFEINPERIVLSMEGYALTVRKVEAERYENFRIVLNSNLFELTAIAQDILNREIQDGDANCDYYMDAYRIRCEKPLRNTDATIYKLTNRNTGEVFQIASRSWVVGPVR